MHDRRTRASCSLLRPHCSSTVVKSGPAGTYGDELDEIIDNEDEKACQRLDGRPMLHIYAKPNQCPSSLRTAAPLSTEARRCQRAVRLGRCFPTTRAGIVLAPPPLLRCCLHTWVVWFDADPCANQPASTKLPGVFFSLAGASSRTHTHVQVLRDGSDGIGSTMSLAARGSPVPL